jgi:hypothetical protein
LHAHVELERMAEEGAMFKGSVALTAYCCALFVAAWPHGAGAEGAVAIGMTGNITKDGYAIGININSSSEAEARDAALKYCRSHGSDVARAKCEIVGTFRDQCAAEAEDPKPGTPGAGWAIAADKAAAEKMAMTNCLATAGDRGSFCKVVTSLCDGSGNSGVSAPSGSANGGGKS